MMGRVVVWDVVAVCAVVCGVAGEAEAARLEGVGVEAELDARVWSVTQVEGGVDVVTRRAPAGSSWRVQLVRVDGKGEVGCGELLEELASRTGGRVVVEASGAARWHGAASRFSRGGGRGVARCLEVGGGEMIVATALSVGVGSSGDEVSTREVLDAVAAGALGEAEGGWGAPGLTLSSSVLGLYAPGVGSAGTASLMGGVAVSALAGGPGFGLRYHVDVSLAGGVGPGLYLDLGGGGGLGADLGPLEVSAMVSVGADWLPTWGEGALGLAFAGWGGARAQARLSWGRVAVDGWGSWAWRSSGGTQARVGARASWLGRPGEYGWGVGAEWRGYEAGGMGLVTVGISY